MGLTTYKARRNFKRTLEPPGGRAKRTSKSRAPLFVVQKHAASHLHYDFRLEMDGVLKSWAVPKGFPTRKGDRRLAVQVEDHPIEYANFEGTIPPGNYGAGTVMVWDKGAYEVRDDEPLHALESGKIHLALKGIKLKGDWTLVRMRSRSSGKPQWLLIKSGEDLKPISSRAENESALTHRSLDQIASSNGPQWSSNRKTTPARRTITSSRTVSREPRPKAAMTLDAKKLPRGKPRFIPPMQCLLVEELPKGEDWLYEIKFDGVRALAIKAKNKLSLISRTAKDLSGKYPEITQAIFELPFPEGVMDGEVVAVDAQGRSDFQLLQAYHLVEHKPSIFYYAFDLLNLEGRDLCDLPLVRRKEMLQKLIVNAPEQVRFSASIQADSARVMREMKARGLEGLIAKQRDSRYEPGRRSGAWVKFKWSLEQEFVIGGYTEPKGSRSYFGAILVGYYEGDELVFASKVGTGFDHTSLKSLYDRFQKLVRPACPFVNLPTPRTERGSLGVTAAEMKRCTWLEPCLVCQIRFSEWTRDGHLRQPVFLGLREDKQPREVVRERPRSARP